MIGINTGLMLRVVLSPYHVDAYINRHTGELTTDTPGKQAKREERPAHQRVNGLISMSPLASMKLAAIHDSSWRVS
jgi:hypothetical protein